MVFIYILFDPRTGEIVHVHRELRVLEEEPSKAQPLSRLELLQEIGDFLPRADCDLLVTTEQLVPVRGYRHHVDLATRKLMLVERPKPTAEVQP